MIRTEDNTANKKPADTQKPIQEPIDYTKASADMDDLFDIFSNGAEIPRSNDANLDVFAENLKKQTSAFADIVVINDPDLLLPCIVAIPKGVAGNHQPYKTMLIEGLSKTIEPLFNNINGEQIEVTRSTAHCYQDELKDAVANGVKKAGFDKRTLDNKTLGYFIVPALVDLASDNVVAVIAGHLKVEFGELINGANRNLTVAKFKDKNKYSLEVTNMFNQTSTAVDLFGLPVASNVLVSTSIVSTAKNRGAYHYKNREYVLSNAHVFFDYSYQEPVVAANSLATIHPAYNPLAIITDSSALGTTKASESVLTHLTAVASIAPLTSGTTFLETYRYNREDAGPEVFGYEHDPVTLQVTNPAPIQLRDGADVSNPDAMTLEEIASAYMYNTMTIGMDMIFGSRTQASQNLLADAAKEEGFGPANRLLVSTWDKFTDGKFAAIWGNKRVMSESMRPVIIHVGSYEMKDGMHDVRKLNYTNTLNEFGAGINESFLRFTKSFEPGNDNEIELAFRKDFYSRALPQLQIRGIGMRMFFEPGVQMAMFRALSAALGESNPVVKGLPTRVESTRGSTFHASARTDSRDVQGLYRTDISQASTGNRINEPYF